MLFYFFLQEILELLKGEVEKEEEEEEEENSIVDLDEIVALPATGDPGGVVDKMPEEGNNTGEAVALNATAADRGQSDLQQQQQEGTTMAQQQQQQQQKEEEEQQQQKEEEQQQQPSEEPVDTQQQDRQPEEHQQQPQQHHHHQQQHQQQPRPQIVNVSKLAWSEETSGTKKNTFSDFC